MNDDQSLSRTQWYALVEEHEKSGLTQTEFCKQKSVSLCRFGYYVKKYRDRNTEITSSSVPSFSQINVQAKSNSLPNEMKIELPNGFKCHVPWNVQAEQLKKILGALLSC